MPYGWPAQAQEELSKSCCLRVWQRTSASPLATQPVLSLSLCQITNYLTVPAHKLDSPTLSRARIGSGKGLRRALRQDRPQRGRTGLREAAGRLAFPRSFVRIRRAGC